MTGISVIIPSLNPNERLKEVVSSLEREGFCDFILVDDGSKEECKAYFPKGDGITLLIHEKNKGKGAALKTAINYVIENRPGCVGVVTCDSDGQHLAKDIRAVAQKLKETNKFILGVRDFSLPDVPPKSRIGNRISSLAIALCIGRYISDTQTGLRAIPGSMLKDMAKIEGDRFEYETNVLLETKNPSSQIEEVKIETVYLDSNKGTHFNPIKDSIRIFSNIFKYIFSSFAAFLTDIILFWILNSLCSAGVLLSTVIARVFSSAVNFLLNKKLVFKSGESAVKSAAKYYALAIPVMFISAFGVTALARLLGLAPNSVWVTILKAVVDTILFILNYRIQKIWVFKK